MNQSKKIAEGLKLPEAKLAYSLPSIAGKINARELKDVYMRADGPGGKDVLYMAFNRVTLALMEDGTWSCG